MKTLTIAFLLMLASLASAQEFKPVDVKPGLWETTMKMDVAGMPARNMPQIPADRLAQLPPEQRQRIEAMMKGGSMPPSTSKSCITREMLDKGLSFHHDNACTYKVTASSSSSQTMHMDCSKGDVKASGDVTIERVDSEHVKGTIATKRMGGPQASIKGSFDSRYVSSNCGDVKPPEMK